MILMLVISLINTGNTYHFFVSLTIKIQEIGMFGTNRLTFVKLVQLTDSLFRGKNIINRKSIELIKIKIVINIFKSLYQYHCISWLIFDVLLRFIWGLIGLLNFVKLFCSFQWSILWYLYWSSRTICCVSCAGVRCAIGKVHASKLLICFNRFKLYCYS